GVAALLEVAVAHRQPGGRPVLALREAVDDPLEVLTRGVVLVLRERLLAGFPDDLVGVAGERRDVRLPPVRAAPEGQGAYEQVARPHPRPRIQSHSRDRPSASVTVGRKERSRRAAVVSANVSRMSPFCASSRRTFSRCPVTSSTARRTSARASRRPPPTL